MGPLLVLRGGIRWQLVLGLEACVYAFERYEICVHPMTSAEYLVAIPVIDSDWVTAYMR